MKWTSTLAVLSLSVIGLANTAIAEEAKPAPEAAPAPKPEVKLPSAEQVIDDYIKATGGEAARRKIKSRKMTAKLTFPTAAINAEVFEYAQAPHFIYRESKIENMGTSRAGSNGKISWMMDLMTGPQILEGEALAFNLRMTKFYHELDWKQIYKSAETTAIELVEGKPCYKVVFTPETGEPLVNYYGKESKLLLRTDVTIPLARGKIPVQSFMSNYKEFAGVLVPTKTTMKMMAQQRVLEIEAIEVNCEIPDGTFDIPAEVQEIIKLSKEKAEPKPEEKTPAKPQAEEKATTETPAVTE